MTTKQTSPARKTFCVWADHVRRVYQDVEAESADQAYQIAKQRPNRWQPCDLHESNGYRLSDEVQDLDTEEFVALKHRAEEDSRLPWRVALSQCEGVYGGEQHWVILGADAAGVIADIEGGLSPQSEAAADFIVRACNSFGGLLRTSQELLERLNLCRGLNAHDERVIRRAEKIIDEARKPEAERSRPECRRRIEP